MTAAQRPRPIERDDLFTLKVVGDAQISPAGDAVAFVVKTLNREQDEYVSNISVWRNGEARQFTNGGKDSTPRWSPDGMWLAFLSSRSNSSEPGSTKGSQIYVIAAGGGEARRITDQKLGAGEPVWSANSQRIAFAGPVPFGEKEEDGGDRSGDGDKQEKRAKTKIIDRAMFKFDGAGFTHDRRNHIHVVDIGSRRVTQVTDGDFNDRSPAWSPEGQHIAFAANRSENWDTQRGSDIWIVPSTGGTPRRVTGGDGSWSDPVFSPDGRKIAFTGYTVPKDKDFRMFVQLWTTDRNGEGTVNLLEGTDLEVRHSIGSDWSLGLEMRPTWNGAGITFLVSERGMANVYRWTNNNVAPLTLGRHDVMSFSVGDDGAVACAKSDATHPVEIFLCRDGREVRLSRENDDVLAAIDLQSPEPVIVTGADGEDVEGWILKPVGYEEGKSYPLLIYIHGGPATAYGETFHHELQWWAAQGFGVAYCNPHGSSSYGMHFQEVIRHDWGNRDYADITAFTNYGASLPWVDEHRLAAAGGSYGGFMVNWIAGHTTRFAAFCTQRSICNMVSQGGTSDFAPIRSDTSGGTPEGDPEHLWNQSPLKYVKNVRTPTLILHQEQDHRCPIEQGEQWFAALKRLGVPTRFIRFPDESHGLSRTGKPSRRHERLGYMLDWFRTYV